jgi:hypothetical protein
VAPPWTLPLIPRPDWLSAGAAAEDLPGSAGNPLTLEQATAVFDDMKSKDYIPFDFPDDGCYARAHEMCRLMQDQGIACGKVWIYAAGYPYDASLHVATPNAPGPPRQSGVSWIYHVAPTVQVQGADGRPVSMVIDPSLSDQPLTEKQWQEMMGDKGSRLEHSDSTPYQRGPDNTQWAGFNTDDDYNKTTDTLRRYSEERDNRLESQAGTP